MVGRLATILKWLVLLPVLAVVALLAVANDHPIVVNFNPFEPDDPVMRLELALYQIAFAIFVLGALFGAFVTWKSQLSHRRRAARRREAARREDRRAEAAAAPHSGLLAGPGPAHRA
ncbi:MAG TPA: lipopolysaccharide assembly protein LapA domain-containing protein [Afifellaceae bacterium]|nr:lipopolysaccharide assembly protein LapA domain-containing protein [Afifellaceae bacterium]